MEVSTLRSALLDYGLEEALKWGKPCFMFKGKNIAIIQPFKAHCSLMFFKGTLIQDPYHLLRSQGDNSQSALRLEFTDANQIRGTDIKYYVQQAIEVEKAGLKVAFTAKQALELPDELTHIFSKNTKLEKAFSALTPGRQRAYVLHFSGAKQSKTRKARVEKYIPLILNGKGLSDKDI